VIPDVAAGARHTIRGHIKVSVRGIVNPDGSVSAVVADRAGPSKYFERIAMEAAEKWTFSPVDTPSRRLVQIRFDFSRDGTTARAVALQ
jgi:TonB family protein